MKSVDLTVTMMLSSVLSRVNMLSACLPDKLQENMEEIRINITSILKDLKCDVDLFDRESLDFLDKVTLYTELNYIYKDLSICFLLTLNNVLLEDALYNTEFVMKKMAECDDVFKWCYDNNAMMRILK